MSLAEEKAKQMRSEYQKKFVKTYSDKNRAKLNAKFREYYKNNKSKVLETQKRYWLRKAEKELERGETKCPK